jgi:photosystem II stability/assembly factor-like uncharacterized protein
MGHRWEWISVKVQAINKDFTKIELLFMKTRLPLLLIVSIATIITSCNKDDTTASTTPPPPTDSLGVWQKINTSDGSVYDIWFIDAANGCEISSNGSISLSSDSGKTWQRKDTGVDNNYLFFYNNQYGFDIGVSSISITKTGGISWETKSAPTSINNTNPIFFTTPSTGYLSNGITLYKTTDTCNSWTSIMQGNIGAMYFTNPAKGYITWKHSDTVAMYATDDSGRTFRQLGTTNVFASAINFSFLQFVDSTTAYFTFSNQLYKATDTGHILTPVTIPPPTYSSITNDVILDINFLSPSTGYLARGRVIYYTNDGGNSFTISCKAASDVYALYFVDANNGWAACADGSILRFKQ